MSLRRKLTFCVTLVCAPIAAWAQCEPDQVQLAADRDNTLYESDTGALSNGAGTYLFTGRTVTRGVRRALLRFDVAGAVPADSLITGATLWLNMSMTQAGPEDVNLHAVLADWGEGTSVAAGEEGGGAASAAGDATWLHTSFDTDLWTTPGGDFAATPSATTTVDDVGTYSWGGTSGTASDVQRWLDDPTTNHGWVLVGNETIPLTAKRFGARENPDPAAVPALCVSFIDAPVVDIPTLGDAGLLILSLSLAALAMRRFRQPQAPL